MRTRHTSREAKDVVRSHTSVLKIHIAYIYALWHFNFFLILLLKISVMKIYYLLYIHGIYRVSQEECAILREGVP